MKESVKSFMLVAGFMLAIVGTLIPIFLIPIEYNDFLFDLVVKITIANTLFITLLFLYIILVVSKPKKS